MPRVVVIDNYDSFTWNVVHALAGLGASCDVFLNDAIDVAGVRALAPGGVVISPGPCTPSASGVSLDVIRALAGEVPILGVCLGHQAIAEALGGRVVQAPEVVHGKTSPIEHDGRAIFAGLPSPFEAMRYHSLVVERASLPDALLVTAWTGATIMGVRHRSWDLEGVQFHPESFLTPEGPRLLGNWLRGLAARAPSDATGRAA